MRTVVDQKVNHNVIGVCEIERMRIGLVKNIQNNTKEKAQPIDRLHTNRTHDSRLFDSAYIFRCNVALHLPLIKAKVTCPHTETANERTPNRQFAARKTEVKRLS